MSTDSELETRKHIAHVKAFIDKIVKQLNFRAATHDNSKLYPPEKEAFDKYSQKLKTTTYGSDEYRGYLKEMKPAIEHHYKMHRHHPEHFKHGILDMNLVDLMEMLADWKAVSLRHDDGNVKESIEKNQARFGYSDDVKLILLMLL